MYEIDVIIHVSLLLYYATLTIRTSMSLISLKRKTVTPAALQMALLLHLKALVFRYVFEESVDCHLLSSFCDDSNLHISLFKYVFSTMGVSKKSISKFLIGNRFHAKLYIFSPYSNKIEDA